MPEIVNVVGGGDLHNEINLDSLADDICAYQVDRKSNGLYIKNEETSPLIIIYRSGKYVITGAGNLNKARSESNILMNMLYNLGMRDIERSFDIYNIVYECDFGQGYNLEQLQSVFGLEQAEYEPEQSPFLVYRPDAYDCVITISSSGKSVINGVRSPGVAEDAFNYVKSRLDEELSQDV